jgi:hypothetical protein
MASLVAIPLLATSGCRQPFLATEKSEVRIAEVSPAGWRRTVNGWEKAEDWIRPTAMSHRSINQWIEIQHTYEPLPVRSLLARIGSIHPLVYSVVLLVFVIGVTLAHEPYVKGFLAREKLSRK